MPGQGLSAHVQGPQCCLPHNPWPCSSGGDGAASARQAPALCCARPGLSGTSCGDGPLGFSEQSASPQGGSARGRVVRGHRPLVSKPSLAAADRVLEKLAPAEAAALNVGPVPSGPASFRPSYGPSADCSGENGEGGSCSRRTVTGRCGGQPGSGKGPEGGGPRGYRAGVRLTGRGSPGWALAEGLRGFPGDGAPALRLLPGHGRFPAEAEIHSLCSSRVRSLRSGSGGSHPENRETSQSANHALCPAVSARALR